MEGQRTLNLSAMSLESSESTNIPTPPHQISCIVCRQRKVKCDKQQRCSNCVKAGVECVYAAAARPRRRIGNGRAPEDVSREELILRVRRYEILFRKNGLRFDGPDSEQAENNSTDPVSQINTNVSFVQELMTGRLPKEDEKGARLAPQ